MIIWIPLAIFSLMLIGLFLSFQKTTQIPVFINGLIPNLPNAKSKEGSGTTVYIVYIGEHSSQTENEIFRGFADTYGRVKALISAKNVGRRVLIRYRHDAYVSDELRIACSVEAFLGVFIVGFALNSLLFREPEE